MFRKKKTEQISFIFYGNLKKGKKYHYLLPKGIHQRVTLHGFEMYDLGNSPGIIKGNNYIIAEKWTFTVKPLQKALLLIKLNVLEGTFCGKYKRTTITHQNKKCWTYIYNRKIKNKKIIHEW
ncbi:MAG: gamma-glutamylcyclotransferase [Candidatus Woesearchaeota archaeon]